MNMLSTHLIFYVLIVVLLASLIANGILFYTAKKYYTRAKLSEVFPTHESHYQKANASLPPKNQKRVVLFGDSRIEMWKKWPELEGFEFINRGIGGETTALGRARFQPDVLALEPDIVILQTGMNDLSTLGVQPHLYEVITQQCQDNLKFFVESLQARQIEVIFLTIIPPDQPEIARLLVWNNKIPESVKEINHYWLNLPAVERLHIIDTAKVLQDAQGQWHEGVNMDSVHLTPIGYQYLNQTLNVVFTNNYQKRSE